MLISQTKTTALAYWREVLSPESDADIYPLVEAAFARFEPYDSVELGENEERICDALKQKSLAEIRLRRGR